MNLGLIDQFMLVIIIDLDSSLILGVQNQVVLDNFFFKFDLVFEMLFTDVHRVKSHIIVVLI